MPLTVYQRGNTWHYRGTVAGRRLRGTTETEDKKTAERIAAEIEAQGWKSHLDGPESVLTFAQAAILYRDAGGSTLGLEQVEDHWKDTLVKNITAGAVIQAATQAHSGAPSRNRLFISPTQSVINHASTMELCPRLTVKRFKYKMKTKTPATLEWIEAFRAEASPHLGTMALFMFLTGARPGEAAALTWDDLDLGKSTVRIFSPKTQTERDAYLPRLLVVALANLKRTEHVFGYLNNFTAKHMWRKVAQRAGIEILTMHCCRHGFATSLLHKGIDPITVSKLGGWQNPAQVFKTYGHARDDKTLAELLTQNRHSDTNPKGKTKGLQRVK